MTINSESFVIIIFYLVGNNFVITLLMDISFATINMLILDIIYRNDFFFNYLNRLYLVLLLVLSSWKEFCKESGRIDMELLYIVLYLFYSKIIFYSDFIFTYNY